MDVEANNLSKISNGRLESEKMDKLKSQQSTAEIPSIRLTPEQIEEIHADEYSLTLFYATRLSPLTLTEVKQKFPEPEVKKAHAVLERFLKAGLVHITSEGKYYSNFPENYINYSHYRYDGDLEARKDAKVFQLMKEFSGKGEYWKDKTYFSMDAFYSAEQTKEMIAMFVAIKQKAKVYANENAQKRNLDGLKFRRLKFFDMTFVFLFAILFSLGLSPRSYAGGGNDPTARAMAISFPEVAEFSNMITSSTGGNDPISAVLSLNSVSANDESGGGGHDPDATKGDEGGGGHDPAIKCVLTVEGHAVELNSPKLCELKLLLERLDRCEARNQRDCELIKRRIELLLAEIQSEIDSE